MDIGTETHGGNGKFMEFFAPLAANNCRAGRWLEDRISKGRRGVYADIVRITPDLAEFMIATNEANRNLSREKVLRLAAEISGGHFELNGETIKFSRDGYLNDGQHRLAAIIESGTAIDTVVVFGLERDSRYTADAGKPRTAAHLMTMRGVRNSATAAALSGLLMEWVDKRGLSRAAKFTNPEKFRFYEQTQEKIDDAIAFCMHAQSACVTLCGTITWPAFCYAVLHDIDAKAADDFMTRMITGEEASGVINTARQKILRERQRAIMNGNQYHAAAFAKAVFAAWNAWRSGKNPKRLPTTGEMPIPK